METVTGSGRLSPGKSGFSSETISNVSTGSIISSLGMFTSNRELIHDGLVHVAAVKVTIGVGEGMKSFPVN